MSELPNHGTVGLVVGEQYAADSNFLLAAYEFSSSAKNVVPVDISQQDQCFYVILK